MPSIGVVATTTNRTLILFAGTESEYQSVTLNATVRSLRSDLGGVLLPSINPNLGIQPPIPKGLQPDGYVLEDFDYLTLSRLELQATQTLISNVERTELFVTKADTGTVYDLSDRFINGDYSRPISGASVGNIEIGELGANDFNIADLDLTYGDRIQWRQCWGNICLDIATCYILNKPVFNSDGGFLKYKINIGDELALKSDSSRVPVSKYCGSPPLTAGQSAKIYAETHALFTQIYPAGHSLLDRDFKDFTNERPFDFLSALYAPTNQDVRTDENGIIVRPRPDYDASKQVVLTKDQVIEVEATFTQSYAPVTKLRVKNNYTLINDFEIVKSTERSISGVISNKRPWFQGGYTETVTEKAVLGDTEVWSKVIVYGFIPDNPLTESQYNQDPCSSSVIPTTYGIISTKYNSKDYTKHLSEAYLVNQENEWFYTKEMEKVGSLYYLRDNLKTYSVTTHKHTPQINEEICEKDYLHFLTYTRKETYTLNKNFVGYLLTGDTITEYKVKGQSSLNQDSFVGADQVWVKTTIEGAYDFDNLAFVVQPARVETVTTPPTSPWIRPSITEVVAFKNVSLGTEGSLETEPLEAPYCYTEEQLEVFGLRSLRETYGLSLGLSLVVPFYLTVEMGDSILYENNQYIVYNIEVNQTLNQATKNLILCRWID